MYVEDIRMSDETPLSIVYDCGPKLVAVAVRVSVEQVSENVIENESTIVFRGSADLGSVLVILKLKVTICASGYAAM